MPEMAIVTFEGDIHAYLVQEAMARSHGIEVAIVAADRIPAAGGLSWNDAGSWNDAASEPVTLPTEDGGTVDVRALRLVWWRRCEGKTEVPDRVRNPAMRELVGKDSLSALRGALLAEFTGTWISDPYATQRAQNKLLQLRIARSIGLTVPRTLVSNDPERIREFTRAHGGTVIAKTLTGMLGTALEAGRVRLDSLTNDDELRLAPTIYQQEIPGEDHLRVMVFGERVHAARISSAALDWRLANDMAIEPIEIDAGLQAALRQVVDRLGLRMGVFDLKVTPAGAPVFLEVNPQGQFLFVEGMSDMPLTDAFAMFAADELALVTT
jgi:hypothetical protein